MSCHLIIPPVPPVPLYELEKSWCYPGELDGDRSTDVLQTMEQRKQSEKCFIYPVPLMVYFHTVSRSFLQQTRMSSLPPFFSFLNRDDKEHFLGT